MSTSDGTRSRSATAMNNAGQQGSSGQSGSSGQQSGASGMVDTAREAQVAVKETAHEAMDTAKQTVTEMTSQTQEQAEQMITQVTEQVTSAVGDAKEQAVTTFTEQRDRAVSTLNALADALRDAGHSFDEKQRQGISGDAAPVAAIGPFIEDAANRLASSADFLREKDISGLFSEAQNLARKQPMLFMASMFGIGLAGARLLKGTMADDGGQSGQSGSGSYGGNTGGMSSGFGSSGSGSESMPSGFGGSGTLPGQQSTLGSTMGSTGSSFSSGSGLGTPLTSPPNPTRTGYAQSPENTTGLTGAGDLGSTAGMGQSGTAAGWNVDDSRQGGSGMPSTRLTGTQGGTMAGGSGAGDPDTLADTDRTDALLGDASRMTDRSGERRS